MMVRMLAPHSNHRRRQRRGGQFGDCGEESREYVPDPEIPLHLWDFRDIQKPQGQTFMSGSTVSSVLDKGSGVDVYEWSMENEMNISAASNGVGNPNGTGSLDRTASHDKRSKRRSRLLTGLTPVMTTPDEETEVGSYRLRKRKTKATDSEATPKPSKSTNPSENQRQASQTPPFIEGRGFKGFREKVVKALRKKKKRFQTSTSANHCCPCGVQLDTWQEKFTHMRTVHAPDLEGWGSKKSTILETNSYYIEVNGGVRVCFGNREDNEKPIQENETITHTQEQEPQPVSASGNGNAVVSGRDEASKECQDQDQDSQDEEAAVGPSDAKQEQVELSPEAEDRNDTKSPFVTNYTLGNLSPMIPCVLSHHDVDVEVDDLFEDYELEENQDKDCELQEMSAAEESEEDDDGADTTLSGSPSRAIAPGLCEEVLTSEAKVEDTVIGYPEANHNTPNKETPAVAVATREEDDVDVHVNLTGLRLLATATGGVLDKAKAPLVAYEASESEVTEGEGDGENSNLSGSLSYFTCEELSPEAEEAGAEYRHQIIPWTGNDSNSDMEASAPAIEELRAYGLSSTSMALASAPPSSSPCGGNCDDLDSDCVIVGEFKEETNPRGGELEPLEPQEDHAFDEERNRHGPHGQDGHDSDASDESDFGAGDQYMFQLLMKYGPSLAPAPAIETANPNNANTTRRGDYIRLKDEGREESESLSGDKGAGALASSTSKSKSITSTLHSEASRNSSNACTVNMMEVEMELNVSESVEKANEAQTGPKQLDLAVVSPNRSASAPGPRSRRGSSDNSNTNAKGKESKSRSNARQQQSKPKNVAPKAQPKNHELTSCVICRTTLPANEMEEHFNNHVMQCHVCKNPDIPINEGFGQHGSRHAGIILNCEHEEEGCAYQARNRFDLWQHANKEHFKVRPWICICCGDSFPTRAMLTLHRRSIHR